MISLSDLQKEDFSLGGDLSQADIASPQLGTPVQDTTIPGINQFVPIGEQPATTTQVVEPITGDEQSGGFVPAPSSHNAKPVSRSADGTLVKFDNGVIFNRRDQSISYQSPDGSSWLAREGSKPIQMKPKIFHNPEDGKVYDLTDPKNPKPITFPTAQISSGATGEDVLKSLPASEAAIVKKLVNYEIPMPSGFAMRSPYWQRIISSAALVDPTFDASTYPIRMGVRKSFTSGQDARNITSLNTAVGHLEELKKAAEKLDNTSYPMLNQVRNIGRQAIGDPRVVQFNTAAAAVQNELASVFKGTGATDQEINTWRTNLNAAQSPDQVHGAINEAINLMGGRLDALQGKYIEGMGKPANFDILNPKSKQILKQLGREDMITRDDADKSPNMQSATPTNQKVHVRAPDGTIGWIPVSQLESAKSKGYVPVE